MKYLMLFSLLVFSTCLYSQSVKNYEGLQKKVTLYSPDGNVNGFSIGVQYSPFHLMLDTVANELIITDEEKTYWRKVKYTTLLVEDGIMKGSGNLVFINSGKISGACTFEIHPTKIVLVEKGKDGGNGMETIYYRATGFYWGTVKNLK